jgi:hypothetical protein
MNAYELADWLKNEPDVYIPNNEETVCNMLRQQADRIAELEKEAEECWCGGHSYEYLRAKNRLPQEKQSEPVAWMNPTGLEYKQRASDFMYNDALYDKKLGWIPLYTTPQTKPLSDEEIIELFRFSDVASNYYSDTEKFAIEFARAIEAKVRGEK